MKNVLKLLMSVLIISGLATLNGCKGDSGDGSSIMSFRFLFQGQTSASITSAPISGITWTYAVLNLKQFKIALKKSNNEVWSNEFTGLWDFNLLSDQETFWNVTFPRGVQFDEISAQLKMEPSETKRPLTLKATVSTPSGAIPVELYFNDPATLDLNIKNLNANSSEYLSVINFEVNKLLSGITIADIQNATWHEGKVRICDCYNVDLYNKAKAALNSSYSITFQ